MAKKSELSHEASKYGTDRMYLDWLKEQESCLSGERPCDPAHVRRASNGGFGMKPAYSAVPLTRQEHDIQHSQGESGLLTMYFGVKIDRELAHQWFERRAESYLKRWIEEQSEKKSDNV